MSTLRHRASLLCIHLLGCKLMWVNIQIGLPCWPINMIKSVLPGGAECASSARVDSRDDFSPRYNPENREIVYLRPRSQDMYLWLMLVCILHGFVDELMNS